MLNKKGFEVIFCITDLLSVNHQSEAAVYDCSKDFRKLATE